MVGPAIFIAITLVWAALLIAGWVLVFWPDEALAAPDGAGPIGMWDRLDHAAALVFGGSTPLVEILPFFHSKEQSTSLSLQIARLDDFLRRRDPEHSPVPDSVCQPLARSIESLLEVIATRFLPTDTSLPDERGARRTAIIDAWCRREGWPRAETADVARMSA